MPIYEVSGVQYSGKWNLQAQAQAEAARKWPEPPGPTFKVYVWGFNYGGALGVGNTTNYSSPVQVGALTDWASVAVGGGKSCLAIKFDGSLYAWGQNSSGELGVGNTTIILLRYK